MTAIPARVIATLFAFACFAGTLLVGMVNGNSWLSVLLSAFAVLCVASIIGSIIGGLMLKTVNEHIDHYRDENPIPEDEELENPTGPAQTSVG